MPTDEAFGYSHVAAAVQPDADTEDFDRWGFAKRHGQARRKATATLLSKALAQTPTGMGFAMRKPA